MLCETWLTSSVKSLLNVPGYQYHELERTSRKGGRVGLLIANEIKLKNQNMTYILSMLTLNVALLNCSLKVET